ncbi:MAG: peptide transporter permease [Acidimicrobiales bacterium]|jgi:hypothetical protein|nr:peptide transporter permease [Acidimicrobiales bacterium]
MTAIRRCARRRLRDGAWGVVALALLIGLAGGAALAALAGARRTETAAPRVWKRSAVADIDLSANSGFTSFDGPRIAKLPQVRDLSFLQGFVVGVGERGGPAPATVDLSHAVTMLASPDGHFGHTFGRFDAIPGFVGRMPDPERADEVVVNPTAVRTFGVHPGSVLHATVVTLDPTTYAPTGTVPIDLTVVGIVVQPNELINTQNQDLAFLLGTPAFTRRFPKQVIFGTAQIRLRDPKRDLRPFEAALHRELPDVTFNVRPASRDLAVFGHAVRPYADALRIFGAVVALAGLLVATQALVRVVRADAVDQATLWAVGATRGQRGAIAVTRAWTAVVAGAGLAVVIAVAASPLFPLGLARSVEPARGRAFDAAVLGAGSAAIVVVLAAAAAFAAWSFTTRAGRADASPARRGRSIDRLARAGVSPSAVVGVRFAYQPAADGSSGTLATTVIGLVAAISVVGAALVFSASLNRFVRTPAQYGFTWSATLEGINGFTPDQVDRLTHDQSFVGVTAGTRGALMLDGQQVDGYGLKGLRGSAGPVATKGRLPSSPNEIALGAQTLRDLHRSVGDTITATANDDSQMRLRIVGRTLLPALSQATALGAEYGAVITLDTLYRLNGDTNGTVELALVDLAPGSTLGELRRRLAPDGISVAGPSKPGDIRSYQHVSSTPLLLVALLAILGIGVLVHLLVTSVRDRRRDLAILKAIGFARRQVWATVAWQAAALVIAALVVAIPLGIAGGRRAWQAFDAYLGSNSQPSVPVITFVAIPAATLVVAIAIAAFPARAAARTPTAVVLAAE